MGQHSECHNANEGRRICLAGVSIISKDAKRACPPWAIGQWGIIVEIFEEGRKLVSWDEHWH